MAETEDDMRRSENQSMRKSRVGDRYFRIDPGYNKEVYENTFGNWMRIIGTFCVYYLMVALFWFSVFFHGIQDADSAAILYLILFGFSVTVIGILLVLGHCSTKKLVMINKITVEMDEEIKKRKEDEKKAKKKADQEKERERLRQNDLDEPSEASEGDASENEGDSEEPSEESG